jgi:ABC-2 type transport system permease protein
MTLKELVWYDFGTFLREPPGNVFSILIPLIALVVSGLVFGNVRDDRPGGFGATDLSMPGQLTGVIAATGFLVVPVPFLLYRKRGQVHRADERERPPLARFVWAQLVVALVVILAGTGVVFVVGRLAFDIRPPLAPLSLAAGFVLCCVALTALGAALGALFPNVLLARALGFALFILNLIASGSAMPEDQLPAALRMLGTFLPLTYVRRLLADLWFGHGWNDFALFVLSAVLVVSVVVAVPLLRGRRRMRPASPS